MIDNFMTGDMSALRLEVKLMVRTTMLTLILLGCNPGSATSRRNTDDGGSYRMVQGRLRRKA